jgi:hypothetical protein
MYRMYLTFPPRMPPANSALSDELAPSVGWDGLSVELRDTLKSTLLLS